MEYSIFLTSEAEQDLDDIYDYIFKHDSPKNAEYVITEIEKAYMGLETFRNRGTYPKELLGLGIKRYRELYFKPYRIIYRIKDKKVFIMFISDGRRNMRKLLQDRLLKS